jgi:hypothetical protein
VAQVQPLDALLVERSKFAELGEDDRTWLRLQVEEGVAIVGVGIGQQRTLAESKSVWVDSVGIVGTASTTAFPSQGSVFPARTC